ncbi:MAG: hypothetical protein JSS86_06485 [Cyanobacteria bacterium SZAS LIN-2]|nr:hypothetical protein [Cyanobacteria bacterium SZAS LIN-2]
MPIPAVFTAKFTFKGIKMTKLALRVLLTAFFLVFVLPLVPGAHFTGGFWPEGVAYGVLMAAVTWAFGIAIAFFTIGTLGLGAILLIFGFWLIPAMQLQLLAYYFPQNLAFDSWGSAILAGLVMMVINILTGSLTASANASVKRKNMRKDNEDSDDSGK